MPWTPEEAREMARKGGLARAEQLRQRSKDPDQAVKDLFLKAGPHLAEFLLDIALGRLRDLEGNLVAVDAKTRIEVAEVCLAYGLGKPGVRRETPRAEDEAQEGLVLS